MHLALLERAGEPPPPAPDPSPLTLGERAGFAAIACRAGLRRGSIHRETVERMERLFAELSEHLSLTSGD